MLIIFSGAGSAPGQTSGWLLILLIALTVFTAGAVVGAIHGCVLVWLFRQKLRAGASAWAY